MASLVWAAALLAVVLAADLALAAEAGVPALPGIEGLPSVQDLPDLLVMMDGSRVTTREAWETRRKPELKALFQHYMYGFFPPAAKVRATVAAADVKALGGAATMKRVALGFEPPGCPAIDLLVVVPNRREGPAPVFLGLNFTGNHTVLADPSIPLAKGWMRDGPGVVGNRATEAGRGTAAEKWAVEHVVGRGYAVATFYYGDMVPDKPEMDGGVYPHVRPAGAAAPSPTDWGAIAAWAWGRQRAV
ncbi:MAG: acetylxylan esterase, partial [Planctomycetes bacterium]|nr:acetylxylan esterase [Planctomycetota bacterium]